VLIAKMCNYEPIILEFVSDNMNKHIHDLKNNSVEYKNALNQIKKYEIDNKLYTKRLSV
jgi:hypothetical protein